MPESHIVLTSNSVPQWVVVKTMHMAEKKVQERISAMGFDTYVPLYTSIRIWSDRKKKIEKPLIPSVVFVKVNPAELKCIYPVSGVASVLTFLGKPAKVQDFEIQNLRILMKEWSGTLVEPVSEHLGKGEMVKVVRGPFKGLLATSVTLNGNHRVVVKIESIGTNIMVNVPRSFLKKLTPKAA